METPLSVLSRKVRNIMKKKTILSFIVLCITVLVIPLQIKAQDIPINLLYECSKDILIYEEPDYHAEVLNERKAGELVYVIAPGTTWSKIFYNGEAGYVLTQYLRYIDKAEISEDEAFREDSYTKEYEEALQLAYKTDELKSSNKKVIVPIAAVGVVVIFVCTDVLVLKYRKKKKAKKVKNKNA